MSQQRHHEPEYLNVLLNKSFLISILIYIRFMQKCKLTEAANGESLDFSDRPSLYLVAELLAVKFVVSSVLHVMRFLKDKTVFVFI